MLSKSAGRPRSFDRDDALRHAAHLFWQHGYSGTSTRMLTAALGISSSSLYAAFGTKAALFDEAVRTYALRYSAIYERAVDEPTLPGAISRLLIDSIDEFARTDEGHPGCLTSSAVMADSSLTIDVRRYVADLHRADGARLTSRIERAVREGELDRSTTPTTLAEFVQTLWHGLSARSELGAPRAELVRIADSAVALIASRTRTTTPSNPEAGSNS